MTINRRLFLGSLVAAPAIVKAENIMKIWVPKQKIRIVSPQEAAQWKAASKLLSSANMADLDDLDDRMSAYAEYCFEEARAGLTFNKSIQPSQQFLQALNKAGIKTVKARALR